MEDGKSINTIQRYVGEVTAFIKYLGTMNVEFDEVIKRFYIISYASKHIKKKYLLYIG